MKILIHRKDNIGDAILSLPLIAVLRQRWPDAAIDYWGPDYVIPAMAWSPALSSLLGYRKAKHAGSLMGALWYSLQKGRQMLSLRRSSYDLLIYVGDGSKSYAKTLASVLRPREFLSFTSGFEISDKGYRLIWSPTFGRKAEYIEILKLAEALGIHPPYEWETPLLIPPPNAVPPRSSAGEISAIGVHLSARRVRQRWPVDNFACLIAGLLQVSFYEIVYVTWSPGASDDPSHPGDDEIAAKLAERLSSSCQSEKVVFKPTATLTELLQVQLSCQTVVCADGGAMHLAAALGKQVVALFGDSDPVRWAPMGSNHSILVAADQNVKSIDAASVLNKIGAILHHDCYK